MAKPPVEVTLLVNLAVALACKKGLEDTIGIHLPLLILAAGASEVANDDLARIKATQGIDEFFQVNTWNNTVVSVKIIPRTVCLLPLFVEAACANKTGSFKI